MWNTILFDFDGTLVDTAEGVFNGLRFAFEKELGMSPEEMGDLRRFIGPPFYLSFSNEFGLEEARIHQLIATFREYYGEKGKLECALYPGIKEMLAHLAAEHFTLCVASSKPQEYVEEMLEFLGVRPYFLLVGGARSEKPEETKAEVIERVLARIGMTDQRGEVVLIGDTHYDMEGAKQTGVAAIGVSYGYEDREVLASFAPACIVDNAEELKNVLIGQAYAERRQNALPSRAVSADGREDPAARPGIARRLWRLTYPMLIFLGVTNLVSFVIMIIAGAAMVLQNGGDITDIMELVLEKQLLLLGVADAIAIPVMFFLFSRDEKRRKETGRGNLNRNRFGLPAVLSTILFTVGGSALIAILMSFLPIASDTYDELSETIFGAVSLPWQILIIAIIAPISEELLFRAVIYRRCREHQNVWIAALVSGVLFGVFHGNLYQGFYTALLGFLICLLYEHYGTIWAPIIAHMANNLVSTLESHYLAGDLGISTFLYLGLAVVFVSLGALWMLRKEQRVNQI